MYDIDDIKMIIDEAVNMELLDKNSNEQTAILELKTRLYDAFRIED